MSSTTLGPGVPPPDARATLPIAATGLPSTLRLTAAHELRLLHGLANGLAEGLQRAQPNHGLRQTLERVDAQVAVVARAVETVLERHGAALSPKTPARAEALGHARALLVTVPRTADTLEGESLKRIDARVETLYALSTSLASCVEALSRGAHTDVSALESLRPLRELLEQRPVIGKRGTGARGKDPSAPDRLRTQYLLSLAVLVAVRRAVSLVSKGLPPSVHESFLEGLRETRAASCSSQGPREARDTPTLLKQVEQGLRSLHCRLSVAPTPSDEDVLRRAAALVRQGARLDDFSS